MYSKHKIKIMNNFKNNNRRSRFKPNGDRGFRRNGNGNKPNGDFGNGSEPWAAFSSKRMASLPAEGQSRASIFQ